MLTAKHFPERHRAENIAKTLRAEAEFGTLEKVPCVVHDQGSSMKAAIQDLQEDVAAGLPGDANDSNLSQAERSDNEDSEGHEEQESADDMSDEGEDNFDVPA